VKKKGTRDLRKTKRGRGGKSDVGKNKACSGAEVSGGATFLKGEGTGKVPQGQEGKREQRYKEGKRSCT